MVKNIFSNWGGLLVLGLISLAVTPALVHGLGNNYYGMWVLVGSFLDYSGLLDMGMRATVFRYVAYFKGANQRKAMNETFATALVLAFAAMSICALAFIALSFVLPVFFKVSGANKTTFSWVVMLMGMSVSIAFPGQLLSAYLRGLERFDLYNLGLVIHGIVRCSLLLALIKLKFGILTLTAAVLIMSLFFLALHGFLVRWADPELKVSFSDLNWTRTREMFSFGFYSFVNNSGELLRYSTDNIVIGRMLGVASITPFSIATRLIEYFRTLSTGMSGPVMVRLSELSGQSRENELREEFLRDTRICMLISLFIGGLLIVDGRNLICLWMGSSFPITYSVLLILTLGHVILFGQIPSQLLIFAQAKYHKAFSLWTLVEGAANLILSIFWARKYGLIGVALGTTVPLIISKLVIQPWYVLKDLRLSGWQYFRKGLGRPLIAGGAFMASSWVLVMNERMITINFLSLAISCALQSLIFALFSYLLGLAESDKGTLRRYRGIVATAFGIGKT